MRRAALGLVLMLSIGLLTVVGNCAVIAQSSADGSVAWPAAAKAEPGDIEAASPITCAVACSILFYPVGCTIPGTQLDCVCTGGHVCCSYYRCLESPWWKFWQPCYCGVEIECTGIPCTPGQPIPESAPTPGEPPRLQARKAL
jgi:hypothetical protein